MKYLIIVVYVRIFINLYGLISEYIMEFLEKLKSLVLYFKCCVVMVVLLYVGLFELLLN